MMAFDLLIEGARVVDGSGAPGFTADIAVRNGRIAAVGKLSATAKRVIDAHGLVVAPGAIDVHTHYDAQLCWDGTVESSAAHGTTTVVIGNCGIGVAPCREVDRDLCMNELVVLEGISYDTMKAGITWGFESFPEYLHFLGRRGLGIDVAALVPLGPLRRWEMGGDATEREATLSEATQIAATLRQAIIAGGFGFSGMTTRRQAGFRGRALPAQLAGPEELDMYARVLAELGRGMIQMNVIESLAKPTEQELARIDRLLEASGGRPVTYSGAFYRADDPGAIEEMLRRCEPLRRRGAMPQTTIMPLTVELDFRNAMILSDVAAFRETFNRPLSDQQKIYADPAWRARAKADLRSGPKLFGTAWESATVLRVKNPLSEALLGKTILDVAAARGADPFDAMIDLAIENDLELKLIGSHANNDHARLGQHIKDERVLVGLHDGGAHVDQMFQAGFPTYMLGHWVRDEKVIALEHAVRRMTAEPAEFMRLTDRGRIAVGMRADLMAFDPERVGSAQPPELLLRDLPASGVRLFASPKGMEHVFVAGEAVVANATPTGAMPGRIVAAV